MYLDQFPLQLSILCKYHVVLSPGGKEETRRHAWLSVKGLKIGVLWPPPQQTVKEWWVGGWSDAHCFVPVDQKANSGVCALGNFLQCSVVPEGWTVSLGHQLTGVSLSPLLVFTSSVGSDSNPAVICNWRPPREERNGEGALFLDGWDPAVFSRNALPGNKSFVL